MRTAIYLTAVPILVLLVVLSMFPSVAYAYLNVTIANHTLVVCGPDEPCQYAFMEQPVNITVGVYDLTLQTFYGSVELVNAYGINITDDWFMNKVLLFNSTILFYPLLAEELKIQKIELTQIRKDISFYLYVPPSQKSKWEPPMLLVVFESINNTRVWGQVDIVQAESYITTIQVIVDIPFYWYQTYGQVALYSLPTGSLYVWSGVQFEDVKYLTLPSGSGVTGRIVIETVQGEKIVMPSPVTQMEIHPITLVFRNLSSNTYLGILGLALIAAIAVWAYKTENDPFTASAFAGGIVGILGLILGNVTLASIGFTALIAFIAYRIVRQRGYYY